MQLQLCGPLDRCWEREADSGPMLKGTASVRGRKPCAMSIDTLGALFSDNSGSQRMYEVLNDPSVSQIVANGANRIFVTYNTGEVVQLDRVFPSPEAYLDWLNELLTLTDAGVVEIRDVKASVVEGSFSFERTNLYGSIHIATREVTRAEPYLTVRKQPAHHLSLEDLHRAGMMSPEMYLLLKLAVRGRLNILVSGGSGAGKTTMVRALCLQIDPANRILTAEDIDELHLADRLPNVAALTTYRVRDEEGRLVRETTLDDLVREALRMRADRVLVGETRGKEAFSLVKAANSGHDGCITTIHADDGQQAVKQMITYIMEAGVAEEVARDAVARAFHLVVQIQKGELGQRRITEITELESVREGTEQRRNVLYAWDPSRQVWVATGRPSQRLRDLARRYNVNLDEAFARPVG